MKQQSPTTEIRFMTIRTSSTLSQTELAELQPRERDRERKQAIINQGSRLEHLKRLIHTKMCGSISLPLIRILEL